MGGGGRVTVFCQWRREGQRNRILGLREGDLKGGSDRGYVLSNRSG